MIRALLLLCLLFTLTACEPCAVVIGAHCQDRQQEDDSARAPASPQPTPLWPHSGARG